MNAGKQVNLSEILRNAPNNLIIQDSLTKAHSVLGKFEKIICSISGGSDSDIMIDIVTKFRDDIDFVWFDTGVEYQATKEHLLYLEERYGIEIKREKAIKTIPVSCREYGQPFLNKHPVSEYIYRLQKHGFDFANGNRSFEELYREYPRCRAALRWWCNDFGEGSQYNISRNKGLKEFLIQNPPTFKVSNKCCQYAKKDIANKIIVSGGYDLNIVGIRKYEGGERVRAYKTCFDNNYEKCSKYRPLFWYSNKDKEDYDRHYDIRHSRCYTEYGLKRTGCVGCPYGRNIEQEIEVLERNEPLLHKAACNIFRDSYEYTRKYREFVKSHDSKDEQLEGQMTIDEYLETLE